MRKKPRYTKIDVKLAKSTITLYAGSNIATAASDLAKSMNTYDGVKYVQILEAVYNQGRKDGASKAFEAIAKGFRTAEEMVPHKNPGRPKRRK